MKIVHLYRFGGKVIRIVHTGCKDFPYEWSVSEPRARRQLSPTSYGGVLSAREEAEAYVNTKNNPPKDVRYHDIWNYRAEMGFSSGY